MTGAVVAIALALGPPAAAPAAAHRTVRMGDVWFAPRSLSIRRGSSVRWRTVGQSPHAVAVASGPRRFSSPVLPRHRSWSRRFDRPGVYRLYCSIHGRRKMSMRLTVR